MAAIEDDADEEKLRREIIAKIAKHRTDVQRLIVLINRRLGQGQPIIN